LPPSSPVGERFTGKGLGFFDSSRMFFDSMTFDRILTTA
jgi:hypothetical protein